VASLARVAVQPRRAHAPSARTASLVIVEKTGIDRDGDLVAGGALPGQLFVDLPFDLGQRRPEALGFGLELVDARTELVDCGVEGFSPLHDLELAVLETAPVTPKLVHVRLECLELAWRGHLARVHAPLDFRRLVLQ